MGAGEVSRVLLRVGIGFLLLLLAGCEPQKPPQDAGRTKPQQVKIDLVPPGAQETGAKPPATVQEKAGVGSGEKGRGYGGGLVTTPVAAYFAVQERLVFDIQIPHAMKLYKATEGHAPKTHDEFMRSIVEEIAHERHPAERKAVLKVLYHLLHGAVVQAVPPIRWSTEGYSTLMI